MILLSMTPGIICILVGILGLLLGSYLNSWMWRMHEGKWRWGGRSMCVHCARTLSWWENIPLISFIILGGACRTCKRAIPRSYFLLELCTPLLLVGVAAYHVFQPTVNEWHFFRDLFFTIVLLVVFMYDFLYSIGCLLVVATDVCFSVF